MAQTSIALCADTHFWPGCDRRFGNEESQMQPWSQEILAVLLAELSAARPDFCLHLGDFTCGGGSFGMSAAEFAPIFSNVIAEFERLPAPFYGLPGNHDSPLGQPWTLAERLLDLSPGLGRTIDTDEARLILLNAQGHTQAQIDAALPNDPISGWVNEAELGRLGADLAGAGKRPVVVFLHQLLRRWQGEQPWADLYGVSNGEIVLDALARYGNVRAVFQAHAHRLDVRQAQLGGQPCSFVVLPAVIEYPMAWLELTLQPTTLQVQMRRLPLLDLAESSRQCGGTTWRAGRPDWRNCVIPLTA